MSIFNKLAQSASKFVGKPACFCIAIASIIVWALSGPIFGFSDTWQLIVNTSTTIITFLMVFLIQNTQNRDMISLQLKLDELIKASKADNTLINVDQLTDQELAEILKSYQKLAEESKKDEIPT